jgi:hypothetical protein
MARTCTYTWGQESGRGEWSFGQEAILLLPEEGPPLSFSLKECAAVSGDGHALALRFGDGLLRMQRLGQDGTALLDSLRHLWPAARAEALRLSGTGEPRRFHGALEEEGGARPCEILLFEDVLLLAAEGEDLRPAFVSLLKGVRFDEAAYTVTVTGWDGQAIVLSKLAGQTRELLDAVKASRAGLAKEGADLHARHLPTLGAAPRAALSALWLPGRMMAVAALEDACPGFRAAFDASWLGASLRTREGRMLLEWAGPAGTWLGYGRPGMGLQGGPSEEEDGAAEPGAPAEAPKASPGPPDCLLWMLCGWGGAWLLETLTEQGHATYRFEGGGEMTHLASCLLCAPQFSREALYKPLESLSGEISGLAVAARELGFLRELRARFKGRAIHAGEDRWRREAGI